eukprot:CAMPEP_0119356146 /NCGR_PEP_ID=MMETSP1334-20130426/4831_1 /TAXON_ID=127549 /ORGANISM="Calcidiscus leptoporus, Strain RCC1130" /LENGTH=51 /DNA_ID=CAMNT_0007370121 /DNA_START=8 /DNA_END=160 /DNA_ORIENTATION=-
MSLMSLDRASTTLERALGIPHAHSQHTHAHAHARDQHRFDARCFRSSSSPR